MIAFPFAASSESRDRVDSGTGTVHERTIEFGDTVIALHNVGSMTIIEEKRDPSALIIGIVLSLFGLLMMSLSTGFGMLLLAGGAALVFWSLTRVLDVFLSIGTCDGSRLQLVSKDRPFLNEVRALLRTKIDENSTKTATINISAKRIDGGVAIGANARAAGRDGSLVDGNEE